jgi:hypothetical protein
VTAVADGERNPGPNNVLAYPDQALFLGLRAAGQEAVMQALWIYEHPVDLEALRRFQSSFGRGLMARAVEPSPLPFGRHRWVAASAPPTEVHIAESGRERNELYDWADDQVNLPLDPQWGPGWRMSALRFADGSTAVSLVVSHCIADGVGAFMAVVEAVNGTTRHIEYPPPRSRSRRQAVVGDLRQIARDLPELGRTIRKAVKVAVQRRSDLSRPSASRPAPPASDGTALLPSTSIFIDSGAWDALAESLGGNSFSLVAAFAGRIAEQFGRTSGSDGAVTLMIPVSEREGLDDTGGNVVSIASVRFDPEGVTADLSGVRTAIRTGLKTAREVPDEVVELLPLLPFVPKRAFGRIVDVAFGFSADLPVSVSNFGDLPAELNRIDGTAAEYFSFRGVDRNVTRESLDRRGGILTVTSGRIDGTISLSVISHQSGARNSQRELRELVAQTLAEFGLTGEIA